MEIEEALKKEQLKEQLHIWSQGLKKSPLAIVTLLLVVLALLWSIYKSGDKVIHQEKIFGKLVGLHQVQSKFRATTRMLSIKIPNEATVQVIAPEGLIIKKNAIVELDKMTTEQGAKYYYFKRYTASNASLH